MLAFFIDIVYNNFCVTGVTKNKRQAPLAQLVEQ